MGGCIKLMELKIHAHLIVVEHAASMTTKLIDKCPFLLLLVHCKRKLNKLKNTELIQTKEEPL